MQSAAAQAAAFVLVSGLLLVLGYSVGRRAARPQTFGTSRAASDGAAANLTKDFDPSNLTDALVDRLRAATAAVAARPSAALAAAGAAEEQRKAAVELHVATLEALSALASSFTYQEHPKMVRALGLLGGADSVVQSAWLALLPVTAERLGTDREAEEGRLAQRNRTALRGASTLGVMVTEKPFGMHVRRGTTLVAEVFPGFRAQKAGVRKGCELKEIAGKKVEAGTWLELFQSSPLPFPMKLSCGAGAAKAAVKGALSEDLHTYRVMVTKKPYGMNIQVNTRPRVVEVLPGYPAETAGVRRGFVLTEVNEVPVDAQNWFEEYQSAQLPFTLTFDTQVPVQEDNPFFTPEQEPAGQEEAAQSSTARPTEEPVPAEGFVDFRCSVESLPFGMQIAALPHRHPRVRSVLPKSPAERVGVREGDVLVEVAGRSVNSGNWFKALQQALPPYGILLRRPGSSAALPSTAGGDAAAPPPAAGDALAGSADSAVPPHGGSGHSAAPPPAGDAESPPEAGSGDQAPPSAADKAPPPAAGGSSVAPPPASARSTTSVAPAAAASAGDAAPPPIDATGSTVPPAAGGGATAPAAGGGAAAPASSARNRSEAGGLRRLAATVA